MNWVTDMDGAVERCGDLPDPRSLPHMTTRQTEFAAGMRGPNGEVPAVRPSFLQRIVDAFKRTPEAEVDRLRQMVAEVAE